MGLVFSFLALVLWGVSEVFYKKGTQDSDSKLIYVINIGISCVLGIAYGIIEDKHIIQNFNPILLLQLFPVGALIFFSRFLYIGAVKYTYISISSPIMSSTSIFVVPLGIIILGETLSLVQTIALICLTICVILLSGFKLEDFKKIREDKRQFMGIGLAFLYLIVASMIFFSNKWFLVRLSSGQILFYQSIGITIFLIFYMAKTLTRDSIKLENLRKLKSMTIGTTCSAIGYNIYILALKFSPISIVQPLVFSYSIVTLILSRIFLKEQLSIKQNLLVVISVICIIAMTI